MEVINIFNLIYTKVPPEDSPWGKTGFHTVFYPTGLMTKEGVFELERRIHFPVSGKMDRKETVFYQKIRNEYYLVILHIRNLPEARDMYGRGGIFLCHGFIFPPVLWRDVPVPLTLFELVKDSLFTTREDVFSSSLVNRKTGNIHPIEVPQERLKCLSKSLPKLISEFDWRMVMLLNNFARLLELRPTILLKGKPACVSALMNKLVAYIPNELRVNIGWDPIFEGGNLAFYPLKIVGFKDDRPIGGNSINIDIETATIEEAPETSQLLFPHTPYERWLNHCRREVVIREQLEKAYKLSLMLEGKTVQMSGEVLTERFDFTSANQKVIEDVFLKRCGEIVGRTIARHIASILNGESMLVFLVENLPFVKLARTVENVIIKNRITPKTLKTVLPDSLINAGNYRLRLIARVWKGEALKYKDLEPLARDERIELIRYLLLTEWVESAWVMDLLREDEDVFRYLLSSHDTKEVIEKILFGVISKERDFKGIEIPLLSEVLRQERGFALFRGQVDLVGVLEEFLKEGLWGEREIKEVFSWAKKRKPPQGKFPYITALFYPEQRIPDCVLKDERIRGKLIECLVKHHGCNVKDLERLGFDRKYLSKIEAGVKAKGLTEKVKGFLWFKGGARRDDG